MLREWSSAFSAFHFLFPLGRNGMKFLHCSLLKIYFERIFLFILVCMNFFFMEEFEEKNKFNFLGMDAFQL